MPNIKKETISGAKWLLLQKITLQPLTFIYSMVLARLISPEEMGIVGLTAVFFAVAGTLASAGFGTALIRKIDRTDLDCDTAFWFNVGMSFLLSAALYLSAPYLVCFYQQPELLWLTRCSAAMMFLGSTAGIHWTLFTARRDFKTPAIIQSSATIISMPVCLTMAYAGWGVWALMAGSIVNFSLSLIAVWLISPWKPQLRFSTASFKELFGFGGRITLSSLLHTVYSHLRTFIIGKFYSPADLGMYTKGAHLAELPPQTITGILHSVTYPILATLQTEPERLTTVYRKYIKVASLPIVWGCCLIIALAEPLVELCFGDVWLPCVIYVQIVACGMMFDHICVINLNLLQVLGRADLVLRLEIIKKTISVLMVLYAATISVTAICVAMALYTQFAVFLNTYYTGRFIGHSWWKQQKDYWPYIIMAALSVTPTYIFTFTTLPNYVTLLIGLPLSAFLYLLLLIMRRDDTLPEFIPILENKLPILKKALKYIRQRYRPLNATSNSQQDNN